jgi:outer membrane protein assembly factor BamB
MPRSPARSFLGAAVIVAVLGATIAVLPDGPAQAADWRQFHAGPSRLGVSPETTFTRRNVHRLTILWRRATGASKEGVNSSPAVADGVVYVGSDDGRLWALRARDGKVLWRRATGGIVRSSPAVGGRRVFVGSDSGRLHAFGTAGGRRVWARYLGGRVTAPPLVVGGRVFVGSRGGSFFALDAGTGKVLWRRRTWAVWDGAAHRGRTVYVGSDREEVAAFAASTGARRWTTSVWGRVRSAPTVTRRRVYVGTDQGRLYALDRATGRTLWYAQAVPPGDGYVRSSPAVAEGRVYVSIGLTTTPMDGKVKAFRVRDGRRAWTAEMADYSTSSPAYANGVLFVGSFDRRLYAIRTDTGEQLWTSGWTSQGGFSRGIRSSPAVSGGRVFVGVRDGSIYSLGLPR